MGQFSGGCSLPTWQGYDLIQSHFLSPEPHDLERMVQGAIFFN